MAYTIGLYTSAILVWGLHTFGAIALATGVVFLIVLAVRTFNSKQLTGWAIGLIATGTVACLLTIGARRAPWNIGPAGQAGMGQMKCMMGMDGGMMDHDSKEMMDHDSKEMMDHDSDGMMGMSMDDMSAMLEGKTGDEFDKAFLDGMIPHHRGAIDMANAALENARHEEIKAMARDIISAQQREIDQMESWQDAWGYVR